MNKDRYNKNRALNLLKGIIPSLIGFFIPIYKRRIIFNSGFNLEFNDNSKYLFFHFLKYNPEFEIKFVINDRIKRHKLIKSYGEHFISSNSLKSIFYILQSKTWVTSSLETPIGGFFLAKRRNIFHLGHGAPLKNIGLSEKYNNWKKIIYYHILKGNFSYFISTSDVFSTNWSKCIDLSKANVLVSGQARNDTTIKLAESGKSFSNHRSVLYAPTWRPFSETEIFPFEDKDLALLNEHLIVLGVVIYVRLHPNFNLQNDNGYKNFSNIEILSRNTVNDINEVLGLFDLVITDYSSIYIDFLLTRKPVLFLPYDYEQYKHTIGFSIDYHDNTPGPKPQNQVEFIYELKMLIESKEYYSDERNKVNSRLNSIQNDHCKSNADLIISYL
ncbi:MULTISPECIES: CDP-glycerol glycerophosphotransferase family protein [unclassified Vibrio]|uniref:CDP-glycerol glycerophosphotransferase family protein n=1 Tax=unclassified Vibrio TaxID=2614977 RepID=UPI00354DA29B